MSFRSRANPDQRRRRVILDESRGEEAGGVATPPPTGKRPRRYSDQALSGEQPPITHFLMASGRRLAVLLAVLGLASASAVAGHWFRPMLEARWPDAPLALLDALNSAGLAQLVQNASLVGCAVAASLIFAVRRRRLDDLRGTYQVWIWGTLVAWLLVAMGATDACDLLAYTLSQIPRMPTLGHPRMYFWLAACAVLLPLVVRLLIEMRKVRAAQLALSAALIGLTLREMLFVGWIELEPHLAATLFAGFTLAAANLLLTGLLLYGRHVKLDAMGVFSGRKKVKKRKLKVAEEEEMADSEPPGGAKIGASTATSVGANSVGAAISSARLQTPDEQRSGPLSKAARKALRKSA